jgi:hypothetical protein
VIETVAGFGVLRPPIPWAQELRKEMVMTKSNVVQIAKLITHASALVFAAFWLVATSAATAPAQQCFTGITNPTTLQVVLGTPPAGDGGAQSDQPSCQGLDGLAPGSTVVLTLAQGARPTVTDPGDECWSYQTQTIEGVPDVTLSTYPGYGAQPGLTVAVGEFSSSTAESCRGGWEFTLRPNAIPEGTTISPFDAGPTSWHVERSIEIEQAQFCDGAFAGQSGTIGCRDDFPVVSIIQVSP